MPDISDPPIARATLPPAKRLLDAAADCTQESVDTRLEFCLLAVLEKPLTEAHQHRLIGHRIGQTQPHEPLPLQSVGHQFLTLQIGQAVAMLERAHFEKHQRRVRRMAGRSRIHPVQRRLERLPARHPVFPKSHRQRSNSSGRPAVPVVGGSSLACLSDVYSLTAFKSVLQRTHFVIGIKHNARLRWQIS